MPGFKSVEELRSEYEIRIDRMKAQLEDLADHIRHASRPSKSRTADAIGAIAREGEWRVGKTP